MGKHNKWKIILINVLLAIITIILMVVIIGMVFDQLARDTTSFLGITGLVSLLVSGFFYELKLLHSKEKGDTNEKV